MSEQALYENAVPTSHEQRSSGSWLPAHGVIDADLIPLGYFRWPIPNDAQHVLTDIPGVSAIIARARTILIYFETYGVHLRLDGGTVDLTSGMPRAANSDFSYTQDLTLITFCNAVSTQNGTVHVEFFS